jgi:hypothetical protein
MLAHRLILIVSGYLALVSPGLAQNPNEDTPLPAFPETEIFLFEYDMAKSDDPLSDGRNVTKRPGYDNQPFFTNDSRTFLYSRDDGTQTDIWEYDIASDTHTQLTATEQSEFSPTPSPDNQTISMVFERNFSIWHFNRSIAHAPAWLLETAKIEEPVGYFARNYETGDILFWSRYGFSLSLTHSDKPGHHFITGHAVPAAPHVIPGTNHFSFVHRQTNEQVWIKALDPETKAVRPLTQIVGSNANYTWTLDGSILQIEGTALFRWHEDSDGWMKISDLSDHGLASANRIAVSPDGKRMAVVGIPAE